MVFCNAAIFSLSLCASFCVKAWISYFYIVQGKYFGFPPLLKWSLLIIFLIWILTFQASAKSGTHSSIGRKGHSFLEPGSLKIFSSRETNTTWRLKRKLEKKSWLINTTRRNLLYTYSKKRSNNCFPNSRSFPKTLQSDDCDTVSHFLLLRWNAKLFSSSEN